MKLLKRISFSLLILLLLVLVTATIIEKIYGTEFISTHLYSSISFIILWGAIAFFSLWYILKRKLPHHPATFLLHLSFLVILAGAFTTWLCSEQGILHLRQGEPTNQFTDKTGHTVTLPFHVSLDGFQILYYAGTRAPMDFISKLSIIPEINEKPIKGEVSMNNIFSYNNYRFYQSGYDDDGAGTRLSLSHDPYGIGITYTGYALLLLSICLFFFSTHSRFRQLLKSPLLKRSAMSAIILFNMLSSVQAATDKPRVLPQTIAGQFGDLYILYNNRICPLQTLAKDFTVKLYGSSSYNKYTPVQIFTGWMYYYNDWKEQPIIKIKSHYVRSLLGIESGYASLKDFINEVNEYKLEESLYRIRSGEQVADKRGIEEADEKFNIITMLYSGKLLKLFPHPTKDSQTIQWYSPNDNLPQEIGDDKKLFIKKSLDYVNEMVVRKDYDGISYLLLKLRSYQQKEASEVLPSATKFAAENVYNRFDCSKPLAIFCITLGLIAFIYYCQNIINPCKKVARWFVLLLNILAVGCFIYLSFVIGLRGYISNHLPLSNGFETMQFMSWSALLLTFCLQRKFPMILPFGFLLCGLTLMVSMLGEANPQITQLMPVLSSPLLSIHVVVIMIAYSLLAFIMLNGVTAIILYYSGKNCDIQIKRLQIISEIILYPAVFLLTAGIFVGAIWANISWGRYWGWDPKEVWALITMLVYALALHPSSLPLFGKPMFFHLFSVVAFLTVLITYFGVNFLLGGMHSYANS
ncbi:cytochrome c biogenesis protein CcsA [uncultured Bacteroides sp.]|uniref:cytochrome c biogenesis protein CcsA n=1 Tax=uncultured Bacteroides sp. TaxID=162156 RepID=UPI0025DFAC6F|nr:cytochrome c biogenesis protein CcsA [uncultured Bacteroides sp.]